MPYVTAHSFPGQPLPYGVWAANGLVDRFRTRSGADHAAHMLTVGGCTIEPHRTIGSRVQPRGPSKTELEAYFSACEMRFRTQ